MKNYSDNEQTSHIYRIMATISFVLITLSLSVLIGYFVSPDDYSFGSETAGYRFDSKYSYLAFGMAQLLFSFLSYWVYLKKRWGLQVGFLLVALVIWFL